MPARPSSRWLASMAALALVSAFGGVWIAHARGTVVEQPIQFNHALHIRNNVSCIVCHPYYETTARAGMPGVNTCRRCHEGVIEVSSEQRKIEAYYESNREIPWQRVYKLPDYVYFSHRRHVVLGGIQCKTCHGDIAHRQKPLTAPLVSLKMADCIACHTREQKKTQLNNVHECIRCHK